MGNVTEPRHFRGEPLADSNLDAGTESASPFSSDVHSLLEIRLLVEPLSTSTIHGVPSISPKTELFPYILAQAATPPTLPTNESDRALTWSVVRSTTSPSCFAACRHHRAMCPLLPHLKQMIGRFGRRRRSLSSTRVDSAANFPLRSATNFVSFETGSSAVTASTGSYVSSSYAVS